MPYNSESDSYAIGLFGETFDRGAYPCRIWAAGMPSDDVMSRFRVFVAREQPDIILINYDLITTLTWLRYIGMLNLSSTVICHLVVDGLPVDRYFLQPLAHCRGIVVPSARVAEYIAPYIDCRVYHFPHLVDSTDFYPKLHPNDSDDYVIGCIAQNRPRKQLQQVLRAIKQLNVDGFKCQLRLHTDRVNASPNGGDNLRRIVQTLGIEANVIATEYADEFNSFSSAPSSIFIANLIRSCHCMLVVPTCGGFEYGIIEAQACGVPLLVTQDGGILEEVSGGAALLVRPTLFDYTSYGAQAFRTASGEIAAMIKLLSEDGALQTSLITAGFKNAMRYTLSDRRHEFAEIVAEIVGTGR